MEYILIVAQDGNFQTRVIFIPRDEFLEKRCAQYEILKENAITDQLYEDEQVIDNLVYLNLINAGRWGWKATDTPCSRIISELVHLATGVDHDIMTEDDLKWYKKSIVIYAKGFDHVKNYFKYKNLNRYKQHPIKVVESFLFLERKQ